MSKLTVCGGGNAAHVLIALAAQAGWEVDVYAPLADEAIRMEQGIAAKNGLTAHFPHQSVVGRPRRISADPAAVIPGSKLVLLALPAFAHGETLRAIAGWLDPGAAVGALPARSGFNWQARRILQNQPTLTLFGLQTLPWACRITAYGQAVTVLGVKAAVDLAALPPSTAPKLAQLLTPVLGLALNPVSSFLALTLANTGQLIHPGIMFGLAYGREETVFSAAEIPLFYQGIDEAAANLLQAMSDEVQAIARTLAAHLPQFNSHEVVPLHSWLLHAYPTHIADPGTLHAAFTTNRAYAGLKIPVQPVGPDHFVIDYQSRYLAEDVPFGLVVVRGLAQLAGVDTPAIDRVVTWAQTRLQHSYLVNGRITGPHMSQTRAPQTYGIDAIAQLN
jgi:hypothetical protein